MVSKTYSITPGIGINPWEGSGRDGDRVPPPRVGLPPGGTPAPIHETPPLPIDQPPPRWLSGMPPPGIEQGYRQGFKLGMISDPGPGRKPKTPPTPAPPPVLGVPPVVPHTAVPFSGIAPLQVARPTFNSRTQVVDFIARMKKMRASRA
jgi:hypothetical protein